MENVDADWSLVSPKKDKKSSPKGQKRKGLKRTDLQRSTSSNQLHTRRKTGAEADESTRPATRSTKAKLSTSSGVEPETEEGKKALAQEALAHIIEGVSSKIQLLSIAEEGQNEADSKKDVSFVEKLGTEAIKARNVWSSQSFCELCKYFDENSRGSTAGRLQTRGLINTGSACFWNVVVQALFSVDVFERLLLSMLERTRRGFAVLDERLRCWGEVLQVAAEFYHADAAPAATTAASLLGSSGAATTNGANGSKNGKSPSKGPAGASAAAEPMVRATRQTAVAATVLMPSLFQTFQHQMDGISGASRGTTTIGSSGMGGKSARKNNQQDAVEFMTFLLDALHEEIIHAEAENARLAAEAALSAVVSGKDAPVRGRNNSSPLLPGSATMSADDYDLLPLSSRQNSCDMVIALTRQNSLAVEEKREEAEEDGEGWSTVSKAAKGKVKAVVVDAESKERADSASKASVISRLFHATLRSEVVYKAKKTNSVTFQRFHCLTLDVGAGGATGSITLESCLNTYFAEESIDEGKVKKQIKLDSLPEILIVQLARFSFDYYKGIPIKIMKSVEYPGTLTFAPSHLSDELRQRLGSAPASYQLQAAVLHHGKKATGGHYSAFTLETQRRAAAVDGSSKAGGGGAGVAASAEKGVSSAAALRDTRVWHSVNDAKVSTISESQALGAQDSAYILFYGRVHK